MRTTEEQLQFVLRFLDIDLPALRTSERVVLQEDLWSFLDLPQSREEALRNDPGRIGLALPQAEDVTPKIFEELQFTAKRSLEIIARGNRRREEESATDSHQFWLFRPVHPMGGIIFDITARDGILRPKLISPSLKDHFGFALGILLAQLGADLARIRVCVGCPRMFYAEDNRQKFCGSLCAKRETMRRLRAQQSAGQAMARRRKGTKKRQQKKKA